MPKFTIKSTDKAALKEYDQKSALYQTMHANKSFNRNLANHRLYHALMEALIEDENAMDKGVADTVQDHKRKHDDDEDDDDEDPPARQNRGKKTKMRRTKDSESFKKPSTTKETPKDKAPSKAPKLVSLLYQRNQLKNLLLRSRVELEYNIKECYKAITDQLDWNNLEGKKYPIDLSKTLPLIMDRGRQVIPVDYFINNDLEYLRGGSSSKKYTSSTKKTKVAKYDIPGIEDMVPSLWIPIKFKEGDFPRLYLQDIEDMLLLLVQKKVSNLKRDVIFDLGMALRMFTRRIVILKRVEDLQLGVESYQKKLNITKPETFKSDILLRTPYTTYNNPQGIIYLDKFKRNRLMRLDKLYKFSDETHTSVRSVLHHIASNLRMDYFPKRRWSNFDKQRSRIMIKEIDKLQLERMVMRNLEKFVGGREYGEDFRYDEKRTKGRKDAEELKRRVKIKGEKKEALLTPRQKPGDLRDPTRIELVILDIDSVQLMN
ncbi:hypothetical protein Tco_0891973 [Tanacetum coccineum]|uniref:Uncharacterized protein n=1 Tax=Tanacetum coccineum TaxID=301880 RepID=A0ABQ5C7S7_9ASTR